MKTIFSGYAFDASQNPPIYCEQQIVVFGENLHHIIEGKERAIVPVEHAPEYVSRGWVGDIGRDNQDLKALRGMHNPPGAEIAAALAPRITGRKRK